MSIDDLLAEAQQRQEMQESTKILFDDQGVIKKEILAAGMMGIALINRIAKSHPTDDVLYATTCMITTMLGGNPDDEIPKQAQLVISRANDIFAIIAACSAYGALYIQDLEDSADAN